MIVALLALASGFIAGLLVMAAWLGKLVAQKKYWHHYFKALPQWMRASAHAQIYEALQQGNASVQLEEERSK